MTYTNKPRYREEPGIQMLQAAGLFNNLMRTGQEVEKNDIEIADIKGINAAYEHIAGKVGNDGDITALDGDPILNTRHGAMAFGRFNETRMKSEDFRKRANEAMYQADDSFYQSVFRPLAGTATEAYNAGDMQRFGEVMSGLTAKSPMPYRLKYAPDGNFDVEFRSNAAGGYTSTGRRLTSQEALQELNNLMSGEQKVLVGASMQERTTNPRFLATAARYKQATIEGNNAAMGDQKQWIPMRRGNHVVYAVPQNDYKNYENPTSYRIIDDSGKMGGTVPNLNVLAEQGYVNAAAQGNQAKLDKQGRVGGSGGGLGSGKQPTPAQYNTAFNNNLKVVLQEWGGQVNKGRIVGLDESPASKEEVQSLHARARDMTDEQFKIAPKQKGNDPQGIRPPAPQGSGGQPQPQTGRQKLDGKIGVAAGGTQNTTQAKQGVAGALNQPQQVPRNATSPSHTSTPAGVPTWARPPGPEYLSPQRR